MQRLKPLNDFIFGKANEKLTFPANDKEVLRLYNMREMAQIDYNSGMRKAEEGGIVEGKIERNIEIAGIW